MPVQVVEVCGRREWEYDGKKNVDYTLRIHGENKLAILTQKPETPAPSPGPMDLTLEPHARFDDKLRARKPKPAFGGGGGRSPEEKASIVRQHSQDMALKAIELAATFGVLERPTSTAEFFKLVEKTTAWFASDAKKAQP